MEEASAHSAIDQDLLARFNGEIKDKVPHLRNDSTGSVIVNATPLVDLTSALAECAKTQYGLEIPKTAKVFGKFDSRIFGGSVKVRPAVEIIEDAIISGRLRTGQTIFEATSGNFGLALGMLKNLGLNVIVLVSRKLQGGVLDELKNEDVKSVNLDIDICPAPGLEMDAATIIAKTAANSVREQLSQLGLDTNIFDGARVEIEKLLARQDVINLAKLMAKIYGGFCPEQYDNELNVKSHETVTAPETDQQMKALGQSLGDFRIIVAFGTGGTSTGLSNYMQKKYGKKSIDVVFPLSGQDVAGIRTKDKAVGLRFYQPELYAGQHEVDFEPARRVLKFFDGRGYDIGESSALALYSCIQMLNYGVGDKFVVMVADGVQKYLKNLEAQVQPFGPTEVTVDEANSSIADYGEVLWTHAMFVPKEEGVKLVASSLGCDESKVKIATAQDVQKLLSTDEIPEGINRLLPKDKHRTLLVCMAGGTSLKVAQVLAKKGIGASSLSGGIMGLSESMGKDPQDLVQIAAE